MFLNPDLLVEFNRLKTHLYRWKVIFCITLFALLLHVLDFGATNKKNNQAYIASIKIQGVLDSDPLLIDTLADLAEDKAVKAVILKIDSPGGTSYFGEELYQNIKKLSNNKPVVSVLETMATSAAYLAALGSDHIIARNMTLTGSIGVLFQSFEAVELANKLGIKFVSLKSSPLKAAPNPMEKITPEIEKASMDMINDSYQTFLEIFAKERNLPLDQAQKLADGRVYTGKTALKLKLIDEIGGKDEALSWLENEKKIPANLTIEDVTRDDNGNWLNQIKDLLSKTKSLMTSFFRALNQNNSLVS